MMKRLLASASILALSSVAVSAADLPVKAAHVLPPPPPLFSWTGCYVGLHGGAGVMKDSNTNDNLNPATEGAFIISEEGFPTGNNGTGTGGIAGGQVGCNYQDGNWVAGLEAEGYWSGIRTTTGFTLTEGTVSETFAQHARNKSDFDIAARMGIAFDRTLIYGKAGWVWGRFDLDTSGIVVCEGAVCLPETLATSQSGTLNGLLLGAGIEHAFTFAPNWTVKLEYNYIRYGSKALNALICEGSTCLTGLESIAFTQHADKQLFKVGFNYLFNPWGWGAAPVVARY
jgi:outer membrane immunogenic protein